MGSQEELACPRLQDGGEKSFSKKKCEKRARAGERQSADLAAERERQLTTARANQTLDEKMDLLQNCSAQSMIQICANWGINLSKGGTQFSQICIILALSKFEANPRFRPEKRLA